MNQLIRLMSRFNQIMGQPARMIRQFRQGNPVTRSLRGGRSALRQIQSPFRQLGRGFSRILPKNRYLDDLKASLKGDGGGADGDDTGRKGISFKRRNRRIPQKPEISQIHLVHTKTTQRVVMHIGREIGHNVVEVMVGYNRHKPVKLRFTQVDPKEFNAHIIMTHLGGQVKVVVDGHKINRRAAIYPDTHLQLAGHNYVCELYAWGEAPILARINAGWGTTVGNVRTTNEDAIGIYQHPDAYMFALADGVGGGEVGDMISEFAIKYLLAVFDKNIQFEHLLWEDIFRKAFTYTNAEVRNFANRYAFATGTTLTAVVIKGWDAHVAHIGDSRLYHWRRNKLKQLTSDHVKLVNEEEGNPASPTRDILLKAIGKADAIDPQVFSLRLQPGDKLFLCSDGVTDQVKDQELARMMMAMGAEFIPEEVITLANERESSDNITAIGLDVLMDAFSQDTWRAVNSDRVYAGYDAWWSLKLQPPRVPQTHHGFVRRAAYPMLVGLVIIAVIIMSLTLLTEDIEYEKPIPVEIVSPTPMPVVTLTPLPGS